MMTNDPIADLLTRIRNAVAVRHAVVVLPHSRTKWEIVQLLQANGYVQDAVVLPGKDTGFSEIKLTLKYTAEGEPIIQGLRRVSRPGQRIYTSVGRLGYVLGGVGATVVSTSKGIMTDKVARQQNLGGEVLFKIW